MSFVRPLLFTFVSLLGFVCTASANSWIPSDFKGVQWLHTDVSQWRQTATLDVSVRSTTITLNYNKANTWPGIQVTASTGGQIRVNANPWIFVQRNGTWYAATFEWLTVGQTVKAVRAVQGDHIKVPPLNTFVPVHGEVYGFMVSGLARDSRRNVQERSEVKMYRWGVGPVPSCQSQPTIRAFRASSENVARSEPVSLIWQVEGAESMSITPIIGKVNSAQGTQQVRVAATTQFTLHAENACGTSNASRTVSVRTTPIPAIMHLLKD